jgi:hypothetical protein
MLHVKRQGRIRAALLVQHRFITTAFAFAIRPEAPLAILDRYIWLWGRTNAQYPSYCGIPSLLLLLRFVVGVGMSASTWSGR